MPLTDAEKKSLRKDLEAFRAEVKHDNTRSDAIRIAMVKAMEMKILEEAAPVALLMNRDGDKYMADLIELDECTGIIRRADGSVVWQRDE